MAAYIYYCTVRYSIMRKLNCVKIHEGKLKCKLQEAQKSEANKSANRWGNLRAKGGVVPPPPHPVPGAPPLLHLTYQIFQEAVNIAK